MLRRCAELTLQSGFDYFVVGSSETQATNQSTVGGIGPLFLTPSTTSIYLPTYAYSYSDNEARARIRIFKGEKPEGNANAYDAREVLKFLAPAQWSSIPRSDQQSKSETNRPTAEKSTVTQQAQADNRPAPVRFSSLLTHSKGRLISSPPMTADAEYLDTGSGSGPSRLIFPGNRICEGEFKLLPLHENFKGLFSSRLLDPDRFMPSRNAIQKGFAMYTDQNGTNMECAFSMSGAGRIDQGRCLDNWGNEYRVSN
jgi:hypothetical protein